MNERPLFFMVMIGCFFLFVGCSQSESKKPLPVTPTENTVSKKKQGLTLETFQGTNGWGYDILRNGKKYIHQPSIPAIGGNKGFNTQLEAQKVGEFVMSKIKKGIMPPSVTAVEVDSLVRQTKN